MRSERQDLGTKSGVLGNTSIKVQEEKEDPDTGIEERQKGEEWAGKHVTKPRKEAAMVSNVERNPAHLLCAVLPECTDKTGNAHES